MTPNEPASKGAVQIPNRQPVRGRLQIRMRRPRHAQRIDIGSQMPALAPGLDQACHRGLLDGIGITVGAAGLLHFPANGLRSNAQVARRSRS